MWGSSVSHVGHSCKHKQRSLSRGTQLVEDWKDLYVSKLTFKQVQLKLRELAKEALQEICRVFHWLWSWEQMCKYAFVYVCVTVLAHRNGRCSVCAKDNFSFLRACNESGVLKTNWSYEGVTYNLPSSTLRAIQIAIIVAEAGNMSDEDHTHGRYLAEQIGPFGDDAEERGLILLFRVSKKRAATRWVWLLTEFVLRMRRSERIASCAMSVDMRRALGPKQEKRLWKMS